MSRWRRLTIRRIGWITLGVGLVFTALRLHPVAALIGAAGVFASAILADTLLELLVIIAISGVLIGMALPAVTTNCRSSRRRPPVVSPLDSDSIPTLPMALGAGAFAASLSNPDDVPLDLAPEPIALDPERP